MSRRGHRWLGGLVLVGAGWLASPDAVPIYDGIGQPDEPYRYVAPPADATQTLEPTSATAQSAVVAGRNRSGLAVSTKEQGPQMSLYLPPGSMAAPSGPITVSVAPLAPSTSPAGARIDGNVYSVTLSTPDGAAIALTDRAAVATLYIRATSQQKPQPTIYHRPTPADPWRALMTTAGGFDLRVAGFTGAGEYAVARAAEAEEGSGAPLLPFLLLGSLVVITAAIVTIRLRAAPDATPSS